MKLNNLKQDIRYSLGDLKEEKFDNSRILLALRKAISALNYKFHLNGMKVFLKAESYKEQYQLPTDFYFLLDIKLNGNSILNEDNYNLLGGALNTFNLKDIKEQNTTAKVVRVDASDNITFTDIQAVKFQGNTAYVCYDEEYTDFTTNVHAAQELDYGFLEVDYVATIEISLTDITLNIPENFYDAIHFKVVSDLLSDDQRTEVQQKSNIYLSKYTAEIKQIALDTVSLFSAKDLLVNYRKGI